MAADSTANPNDDDPRLSEAVEGSSLWHDARIRLFKNKLAVVSLYFLGLMIFLCFGLAWFCKDPIEINLANQFAKSSGEHWMGTDHLGRDLFSRILYGGQISILVAVLATAVTVLIGVTYGAVSGFAGGRVDGFMMRTVDTFFGIPFLVIVIVLKEVLSSYIKMGGDYLVAEWGFNQDFVIRFANLLPIVLAIGAFGWLTLARITRAQTLALKEQEFVESARSLGLRNRRILFRHILPNTLGTITVYTTLTIPSFILYEAALSYLGLGIEAPNASWGILIREGANYLETQPALLIIPGLFFTLTLFALNFLGDGLRDALDVRASKD